VELAGSDWASDVAWPEKYSMIDVFNQVRELPAIEEVNVASMEWALALEKIFLAAYLNRLHGSATNGEQIRAPRRLKQSGCAVKLPLCSN
jgi:hypothetical protein